MNPEHLHDHDHQGDAQSNTGSFYVHLAMLQPTTTECGYAKAPLKLDTRSVPADLGGVGRGNGA